MLFGWGGSLFIELGSGDYAILGRPGASITELLLLVSVGPFLKAFGATICQGYIHLGQPLHIHVRQYMVSFSIYTRHMPNNLEYFGIFAAANLYSMYFSELTPPGILIETAFL